MDLNELTARVFDHAGNAKIHAERDRNALCTKELVELRELLNELPELEAGGAFDSAESCEASTMFEHLH